LAEKLDLSLEQGIAGARFSQRQNWNPKLPPKEGVMSKPIGKSSPESEVQTAEGRPTREEIERRAHQIYVERGAAPGQDVEDWLQAERELLEKYGKTGLKTKAAAV
jgi:hypothetical protein